MKMRLIVFLLLFFIPLHAEISTQRQIMWDQQICDYYATKPKGAPYPFRVFNYLHSAQAHAYHHFEKCHHLKEATLDPLNAKICALLIPNFSFSEPLEEDAFSEEIADCLSLQVASLLQERLDASPSPVLWRSIEWDRYKIPAPPPASDHHFWKGQMDRLKCIAKNLSEEQKENAYSWNLLAGPQGKNWVNIIRDFLRMHPCCPDVFFQMRADMMEVMYDAFAIARIQKDIYCVPRPSLRDPSFHPQIHPAPSSPSYPSGHAAIAQAASTIASYYFPNERTIWNCYADELSFSRLWGGVHYPIDVQMGRLLGEQVAQDFIHHLRCTHFLNASEVTK